MIADVWWKRAVVYQIYPRSFQDSNGDGVGDLAGIVQRLDYLKWLGVDAVWLSPIYPSPMRDFGYDVADYTGVDARFGSLQDFDLLVARSHALNIRLILDVVPNHTSDEHPWFVSSRQSRQHPRRDWYIWRDPLPEGGPPNNWRSVTGGSAWSLDKRTGQYYLHSFLPFQPDLNWRNPKVRLAVLDTFRFWLERGVDGLRIDMVDFLIKDETFRDEPDANYTFPEAKYHLNQPEIVDALREIRQVTDAYPERVAIGEVNPDLNVTQTAYYYGQGDLLQQPFNFGLLKLPFEAAALKAYIRDYERALPSGAWPNYTLGNHDTPRLASRLGQTGGRLAALLLLTLRGTPYLYYGDELGLENVSIPSKQVQDPWEARHPGQGRDRCRTPLPWNGNDKAGFSEGAPWLPIGEENGRRNVDAQREDEQSILLLYRRLIAIRRRSPALLLGDIKVLDSSPVMLMYERVLGSDRMIVALNTGVASERVVLPFKEGGWKSLLSTKADFLRDRLESIDLSSQEGMLFS